MAGTFLCPLSFKPGQRHAPLYVSNQIIKHAISIDSLTFRYFIVTVCKHQRGLFYHRGSGTHSSKQTLTACFHVPHLFAFLSLQWLNQKNHRGPSPDRHCSLAQRSPVLFQSNLPLSQRMSVTPIPNEKWHWSELLWYANWRTGLGCFTLIPSVRHEDSNMALGIRKKTHKQSQPYWTEATVQLADFEF